MIDFRYHLVSLIAVFLAVALGIVIGTTALEQPVLGDVRGQVGRLEQDKRTLETRNRQLGAQVTAGEHFDASVAPALVAGALTGRRVLLVVATDAVPAAAVDSLTTLVRQAGGTVTGTLRLRPGLTDPAAAARVQSYVTGPGLPAGVRLPETGDTAQLVATLLAGVLMAPHGAGSSGAAGSAAISSVLAGLSALDVVAQDSAQVGPADHAVVLTAGVLGGADAAQRTDPVVELAAALDAAGSGAVVAGTTGSAGAGGLVAAVRSNPTVSAAVSTVDDVDTTAGRVSTVLALPRERAGTSGRYGTADDARPVPPLPGTTP